MSALLNRRQMLGSLGGLLVAVALPEENRLAAQRSGGPLRPNAYIHIAPDSRVTFVIVKGEMGQGILTSLAMILADELDCDWAKVQTEFAPVDPASYGPMQGVYGSTSIRTMYKPMRQAGATARQMLILAAADKWSVPAEQLHTENGFVVGPAGQRVAYGALAETAAKIAVPANVPLKDASAFKLIGTPAKRLDTRGKVSGATQFGIDAQVPGMAYATLARCPVFGGKVASFDGTKAKAVPGVKDVLQVPSGVAVIADNTWSAMQGRRALKIEWNEGANAGLSSAILRRKMEDLAAQPGQVARHDGDAENAIAQAAVKLEATYTAPYLSHACMEPLNCTASVTGDSCEIWASTQMPSGARQVAAKITGLKPAQVTVHSMYMGGGFGRRGGTDYIEEAVEISKAAGMPVKLTWSREDDIQQGPFRPAAYVKFAGALDAEGWPLAFSSRVVCPSFFSRGGDGVDRIAVEGIDSLEYTFPHFRVEYHAADGSVPTSFWRSVGYSQNTFFAECFLDELAAAGKKDPLEVRRRLLAKSPRLLAVLNLAAEKAGWGKAAPGRFQGIGIVNNLGSYTAEVAEISLEKGKVRVHRVVCAVDCGQVVNPAIVRQQIESGIAYGLTAALKGEITLDKGRVQQGNFDTYGMLRIDEMPQIEVHIMPSSAAPGGIGEASTPPIAPAVANALFAAIGKRIRSLPLKNENLV
jgi:isoquinoline 1-oxidoreductase beta subunit